MAGTKEKAAPWIACGESIGAEDVELLCGRRLGHAGSHDPDPPPRLALVRLLRHPKIIAALAGKRIGPAIPSNDGTPLQGMRGEPRKVTRGGKDTKPPFRYGRQRVRRAAEAVTATCLSCDWKAQGRHWRPVRRRLAEHVGMKHPRLAEAG